MRNSPHNMQHKRRKNVRDIAKEDYIPDDNVPKPNNYTADAPPENLEGQKKKRYKRRKSQLNSLKEGMQEKKAKLHSKRAKFQNPDEVDYETEPESVHVEGAKWKQVIRSQTLDRAKKLKNRLERYFGKKR